MAIATGDAGTLSRRGFLRVSLQAAIASAGVYGVIEELATKPVRSETGAGPGERIAAAGAVSARRPRASPTTGWW